MDGLFDLIPRLVCCIESYQNKGVDEKGTIDDPDSLKFLQDDEGFFSFGCIFGWELYIPQKILQKIYSLKTKIADLNQSY